MLLTQNILGFDYSSFFLPFIFSIESTLYGVITAHAVQNTPEISHTCKNVIDEAIHLTVHSMRQLVTKLLEITSSTLLLLKSMSFHPSTVQYNTRPLSSLPNKNQLYKNKNWDSCLHQQRHEKLKISAKPNCNSI